MHSVNSTGEKVPSLSWTEGYLNQATSKFEIIMQEIYETEFIDNIFEETKPTINRELFIKAINDEINMFDLDFMEDHKKGEASWLF